MKLELNSKQIEQITGLKVNTLHYYVQDGAIIPDIDTGSGRGSKRMYSDINLMEAMIVQRMIGIGVSRQTILGGLQSIRDAGERNRLSFSSISRQDSGFLIFYLKDEAVAHGFVSHTDQYLNQKLFRPVIVVLSLFFLAGDYMLKLSQAGYDITNIGDLNSPTFKFPPP